MAARKKRRERCPECEARRNTLGVPPPYGKFSNQFSTFNFQLFNTLRVACYPSSTAASGDPPVLLRYPKYSAACALNILTAAPNPARCFAHWARFAGFALWEGCPTGSWLSLIRHGYAVPPSPLGRLPSGLPVWRNASNCFGSYKDNSNHHISINFGTAFIDIVFF